MLFLKKVHVKRFKQWENQATIAHIQNNYTREGQWFCSVQTLAQTRASQKSRACLKERQKQITIVLQTSHSQAQLDTMLPTQMYVPLPFCPDFFCPAQSSRSVPWKEKPQVFVLISISLCFPLYQDKAEEGKQRMKGVIYLTCTLMLRVWRWLQSSQEPSSHPCPRAAVPTLLWP